MALSRRHPGNTMPSSGPVSACGTIGKLIEVCLNERNGAGGINGCKVASISLDDGCSPPRTAARSRKLVEREEVPGVAQSLGIPITASVRNCLNRKGVPQLLIASGG